MADPPAISATDLWLQKVSGQLDELIALQRGDAPDEPEEGRVQLREPAPPGELEAVQADVDEYAIGGGWYDVNGRKVQGKEAAIAALQEQE